MSFVLRLDSKGKTAQYLVWVMGKKDKEGKDQEEFYIVALWNRVELQHSKPRCDPCM